MGGHLFQGVCEPNAEQKQTNKQTKSCAYVHCSGKRALQCISSTQKELKNQSSDFSLILLAKQMRPNVVM